MTWRVVRLDIGDAPKSDAITVIVKLASVVISMVTTTTPVVTFIVNVLLGSLTLNSTVPFSPSSMSVTPT